MDIESPGAVDILESADLVIANTHTEVEWEKRPGTRYLQTWHGTPMKRIHHDVLRAPPGRLSRLELGLGPDTTAVLYAPTWRDDQYFDQSRSKVPLELDLDALIDRLPHGTELLVRTHNMMTGRVIVPELDEVHDVSYHPDIRDLYLAADVLVTDYS